MCWLPSIKKRNPASIKERKYGMGTSTRNGCEWHRVFPFRWAAACVTVKKKGEENTNTCAL